MTTSQQWARLQTESDEVKIRRGAWYKVLKLGPVEVVLDVNRKAIPVPRVYLRLAMQPPRLWTLVPRPRRSTRLPQSWGDAYLVCPNCRERSPVPDGHPATQRCHRCNGLFDIDWGTSRLRNA
jgi:hypothetical protein